MRKLMWFSIGFTGSMALCVYLLPKVWMLPLASAALLAALLLLLAPLGRKVIRIAGISLLGLSVGVLWFLTYQGLYLSPAASLDGKEYEITATATDFSYDTTYGTAVDAVTELDGKPYLLRLYINEKKEIRPGDAISGVFRLRITVPGGLEEATYHSGKGVFLLGYQVGNYTIRECASAGAMIYPAYLRQHIREILKSAFSQDLYPFALALLLGDGTELRYETDTDFQISGIRHIIAVSGLHISILYSLLSAITFKKRYLTAIVALPVLVLFASLAGFTPSVCRSCIMVGLMILAQLFNKEYDPPTSLGFACLVMLLCNPMTITSVSFQLSCGCVAGILLFSQRIQNWILSKFGEVKGKSLRARMIRWFAGSVSVTLGAMSLTTPLSAYYFGTVSLVGILTNLLTLWVVNLIFNGIVVTCLLGFVSLKAASVLAAVLAWPMRYVLAVADALASLPLAAVYTQSPYIVAWLVFVYLLLGVFLLSKKRRPWILGCCACIGLCAALLGSWWEPLTDNCRVTVLDVGQGQSILLQSHGSTYLVDCGGDNDEMTSDLIAQTLLSQGISHLDGIILTHYDRDHAGALPYLLTRVETEILVIPPHGGELPETLDHAEPAVIRAEEDMTIAYGTSRIQIFVPVFSDESNENSLCVLFTQEDCDILITGDRSGYGERRLLRHTDLPDVELLIAGHHGAKSSTCEELLLAVRPETVIISVGEDNPYGHPAPEVLDRLEKHGCSVYRTDENGTIIYRR